MEGFTIGQELARLHDNIAKQDELLTKLTQLLSDYLIPEEPVGLDTTPEEEKRDYLRASVIQETLDSYNGRLTRHNVRLSHLMDRFNG